MRQARFRPSPQTSDWTGTSLLGFILAGVCTRHVAQRSDISADVACL